MKGNAQKILAVFLVCTLVMITAGCAAATTAPTTTTAKPGTTPAASNAATTAATTAAPAATLPIVTKPLTLSLFIGPPSSTIANSMSDLDVMKHIQKITGITIDFRHPAATDKGEALSTMLASGQYTDMIRNNFTTYKGGLEAAIVDKVIFDYTDLVKQHAVNYNKMVADKGILKLTLTDTGKQTVFGSTLSPKEFIGTPFTGLVLRQDWLTELGLAVPVTVDDWYTVLKAFKERKNCEAPLGLGSIFTVNEMVRSQIFVGSYDAAYNFLLSAGKVKFGPLQPGFKDFLTTYSKWYKEGLINKDVATHDYNKNIKPMLANGQVGATTLHPSQFPVIYQMVDKTKNPNFKLAPAAYPQVVKGKEVTLRYGSPGFSVNPILVSTSCKNPVEAIKFVDFLYSKQGVDMCTYGLEEGQTWVKNATTGLRELGPKIMKNSEGLGVQDARYKYTGATFQMEWNWEYEQQQYKVYEEQQTSNWGLWKSQPYTSYLPDLVLMNATESSAYTKVMSQVDPYNQEMILKFITGAEPLSNYDKFVSTIKSMGIEDAEKARQAAYDRFLKR